MYVSGSEGEIVSVSVCEVVYVSMWVSLSACMYFMVVY